MRKVVGLAVALLFARPAVSATTFASLGDLGGPTLDTSVIGLSADGRVAVGSADTTNPLGGTAFRWEDGVIAGLGTTGWGSANAASTDGGVVVGDHWRWDHGVVTTVLGTAGRLILLLVILALGILFDPRVARSRIAPTAVLLRIGGGLALALAAIALFGIHDPVTRKVLLLGCAAPIGFNVVVIANREHLDRELAASAASLSVLCGLVYVPLALWLL